MLQAVKGVGVHHTAVFRHHNYLLSANEQVVMPRQVSKNQFY